MSSSHGKFVWYELMTTDPVAAVHFYGGVVDWTAKDSGMPGVSYTILSAGDVHVAGVMPVPPEAANAGAHPHWGGYVAVDDVDASAAQAETLGGTIHRPADDIPGVGRFAVIGAPQGGVLCLFKSAQPAPAPVPPMTPGHVAWHELLANDGEAAFGFHAALFGWTKCAPIDMGPMGTYQLFAHDGVDIGGMMTKPPAMPVAAWVYYVSVEAIDAAADRVRAGGGQVINGPMEVPGGDWIVNCTDPQGAHFSLVAPRR